MSKQCTSRRVSEGIVRAPHGANWRKASGAIDLIGVRAKARAALGPPPNCALESAVLITLPPGAYTGIVTGADGGTGVGIVEVFEADASLLSSLRAKIYKFDLELIKQDKWLLQWASWQAASLGDM